MSQGRVLGLDVGDKRTGVALSDPTRVIARPLAVIRRTSKVEDYAEIARLVEANQIQLVVCGHPLSLDGSEGPQGRRIRRYADELAETLEVAVKLWDESYSTVDAERIMATEGKRTSARRQREWVDAVAAAVILQSYLDAHSCASPEGI